MAIFEGRLIGEGLRIAVAASRFNEFITSKLVAAAVDGLTRHGVDADKIDICWVPGAFEIPLAASRLARSGMYDAVICLGCVIRGATPHFDYVAGESAKGVARASLDADLPIIYAILTVDTIEQAIERAGTKAGNRGFDAALAAMEMATLMKVLPEETSRENA